MSRARDEFLDFWQMVRGNLESWDRLLDASHEWRTSTCQVHPEPLTAQRVADAVELLNDDPSDLQLQERVIRWSRRADPVESQEWPRFCYGTGIRVNPELLADDLAASAVEILAPDTRPEPAPPRRKQTYEQWHAETVALLAEQEARRG